MNRLVLLAGVAVALAACQPANRSETKAETDAGGALRTISKLDCPQKEGRLELVSAAADGQSCAYRTDNAEVTLRLLALNGGEAKAVLDPVEAELKGLIPAPAAPAAPATPASPATPATNTDWEEGAADKEGKAEINFPGLHIKADDKGADIRLGNIRIDADEGGAEVKVGEQTVVNANDQGAEIRTGKSSDEGVRATYILASEKAASGYDVVGYEARGPRAGPIVVAVVKAREGKRTRHDLFEDIKDLVERNVGE